MMNKNGYGQVEPNHLSAQRTGRIYAQLPAADEIEALENGMFLKMDAKEGVANATGSGEWRLVFNEVKLYGTGESTKDFRLERAAFGGDPTGRLMVPRLFAIEDGDIFTTNLVPEATVEGDTLIPEEKDGVGVLAIAEDVTPGEMGFVVMKNTTMPDGSPAVKLMAQRG